MCMCLCINTSVHAVNTVNTSPTLHYKIIMSRPLIKKDYSMKSIIYRQLMVSILYILHMLQHSLGSQPSLTPLCPVS